jgi:putative transposase
MPYDPEKHRRRSIRLRDYDYRSAGAYFVTLCAYKNICLFGDIIDGRMCLSDLGQVADACWRIIPAHHPHVALDSFVVMPNHVHGILIIKRAAGSEDKAETTGATESGEDTGGIGAVGARYISPLPAKRNPSLSLPPISPPPGSLGVIVGTYKAAVTRQVNRQYWSPEGTVWQRSYYEQVIRSRDALRRARIYVALNPARWMADPYYPTGHP